ncbi:Uncharacterised protein [Starkeya nomas]|uniref:Surface antigen domain-containing protein n=2 Tax=Xanthobacteraceae TaxID=335928 RepID=A0A5S9NB04_9HYPH|nr:MULTISPECIES: RT0821/Lpp0805 family surface protein [Xanthobacteraceae]CAA0085370.1 Uncharacterised protein [Starkeya nomas]
MATQGAARHRSSYRRTAPFHTVSFRTAACWTTLFAGLALAGCAGAPAIDTTTTGSISPRRAAAYASEPVPEGVAPDDWLAARTALAEALREDSWAPSVPWENSASATRGTVTPLDPTVAANNKARCREFLMSFVRDANEEWLQGEACRTERGWWKVDQARLLQRG